MLIDMDADCTLSIGGCGVWRVPFMGGIARRGHRIVPSFQRLEHVCLQRLLRLTVEEVKLDPTVRRTRGTKRQRLACRFQCAWPGGSAVCVAWRDYKCRYTDRSSRGRAQGT